MLILLTIPGLDAIRKGLISVTRSLLKPLLSENRHGHLLEVRESSHLSEACTPSEHLRHQKSIMKSQRNALLIASALIFYWLLYSVTTLVVRLEQLNRRVEKLKAQD